MSVLRCLKKNGDLEEWTPSGWGGDHNRPELGAISRLLELKLAAYREAPETQQYGWPWHYEWTYLGRQTIAVWCQLRKNRKRDD
jgi:hypothetical protein